MEILADDPVHDYFPLIPIDSRIKCQCLGVGIDMRVPIIRHLMIRIHYIEVHLLVGRCLQEAVVQRFFEERILVEPVPVIYKGVDSIFEGCVYPFLHYHRIIILVTFPQRLARLVMPRESRSSGIDDFPFTLSTGPDKFVG